MLLMPMRVVALMLEAVADISCLATTEFSSACPCGRVVRFLMQQDLEAILGAAAGVVAKVRTSGYDEGYDPEEKQLWCVRSGRSLSYPTIA